MEVSIISVGICTPEMVRLSPVRDVPFLVGVFFSGDRPFVSRGWVFRKFRVRFYSAYGPFVSPDEGYLFFL